MVKRRNSRSISGKAGSTSGEPQQLASVLVAHASVLEAFEQAEEHEHFRIIIVAPTTLTEGGMLVAYQAAAALSFSRIALESVSWPEHSLLRLPKENELPVSPEITDGLRAAYKGQAFFQAVATKWAISALAHNPSVDGIAILDMPAAKIVAEARPFCEAIGILVMRPHGQHLG